MKDVFQVVAPSDLRASGIFGPAVSRVFGGIDSTFPEVMEETEAAVGEAVWTRAGSPAPSQGPHSCRLPSLPGALFSNPWNQEVWGRSIFQRKAPPSTLTVFLLHSHSTLALVASS